jgi:hypothetical protein
MQIHRRFTEGQVAVLLKGYFRLNSVAMPRLDTRSVIVGLCRLFDGQLYRAT